MPEPTDPNLRVTASGVVHLRGCPSLRNNNANAVPWFMRYPDDRPCKRCRPRISASDATTPTPATTEENPDD